MNRQDSADFSPKQRRAALLLATGRTVRDTAAEVDAGERTIHTWLADDAFRGLVRGHRDRMLSEALGRLSDGATEAVDALRGLLSDETPSVKLRAAVALLDQLVKVRDHHELAERLAALEARMDESEGIRP